MVNRTFGWVQNPSKSQALKDVVAIFEKDSYMHKDLIENRIPKLLEYDMACDEETMKRFIELLEQDSLVLPYSYLKGKGAGSNGRKYAKCSGIVQAALTAQKSIEVKDKYGNTKRIKKPYQDDWSADGYLRWAISLGFIDYDSNSDACSITDSGKKFIIADPNSIQEKAILEEAYLSYPPAIRILTLLSDGTHKTKFELGRQLGFIGETGFTSIPQNIYVHAYCNAKTKEEKDKIRSDVEGSSDKYARMIAHWLCDIGWVSMYPKEVVETYGGTQYKMTIAQSYIITLEGRKYLNKANGISKSKRISKIVYYEMLATKAADKEYVRGRRAHLIKYLSVKERTIDQCIAHLKSKGFEERSSCILDDILGLESIGITIQKIREAYRITDEIKKLEIPLKPTYIKTDVTVIKDAVRERLKTINHKYLNLIDLSFDGSSDRDFEISTIDLLVNELGFTGMRLGDTRKPDGIISYADFGVIIDNKAYPAGYSLPISQADEMVRYIGENQRRNVKENPNQWWENFEKSATNFYYLFVSSLFTGGFEDRLKNISSRTAVNGGAINSQNLLYLAEDLITGKITHKDCFTLFKNKEILIP